MSGILTEREKKVFELLIFGLDTKEIGEELGISDKTVRNHISNVIQKLGFKISHIFTSLNNVIPKLGVNGRVSAVVELLKLGEMSF